MIAHLRGRILAKRPNQAVVDVNGVGYEVAISIPTFSELPNTGGEVSLHIHTHVREDALALYGFLRAQEKELFERLISVSGIGPKESARSLLDAAVSAPSGCAVRVDDDDRVLGLVGYESIGRLLAERLQAAVS